MQTLKRILICMFSAGWVIPTILSIQIYLEFWSSEGWALLLGTKVAAHSAPVFEISSMLATLAAWWLLAVIVYWAWKGTKPKT